MSVVTDVGAITLMAIPYVLASQAAGGQDPVKKAQVVAAINGVIEQPGGIEFPGWAKQYQPQIISAAIEGAVWLAKVLMPDFMNASKPLSPTT